MSKLTADRYTELEAENKALQETVSVLLRQIRDLKATLSESHANGGTWPV